MNWFFRKKTNDVATPAPVAAIPENHISKKLKNTYEIKFSSLMNYSLFSGCPSTPLAIIKQNGKKMNEESGWLGCTPFPNPYACEMAAHYPHIREIFGEKVSTTIIEYLDKETGQPVAQIYPHLLHVFDGFEDNFMERLNHASRRDLEYQVALRKKLAAIYNNRQK